MGRGALSRCQSEPRKVLNGPWHLARDWLGAERDCRVKEAREMGQFFMELLNLKSCTRLAKAGKVSGVETGFNGIRFLPFTTVRYVVLSQQEL